MDPYLWGHLLWSLLWEIVRACRFPTPEERHDIIMLLYSMRWVIPCKFCRQHYAEHLARMPAAGDTQDFVQWVYDLKNAVNASQGRDRNIQMEEFETRLAVQPVLLSPEQMWTLILVLSCNYPVQGQETEDGQCNLKKHAYALFLFYAERCTRHVPHLAGLFGTARIERRTNGLPRMLDEDAFLRDARTGPVIMRANIAEQASVRHFGIPNECRTRFAWNDRGKLLHWALKQKRRWEKRESITGKRLAALREYEASLFEALNGAGPAPARRKKPSKHANRRHSNYIADQEGYYDYNSDTDSDGNGGAHSSAKMRARQRHDAHYQQHIQQQQQQYQHQQQYYLQTQPQYSPLQQDMFAPQHQQQTPLQQYSVL